MRSTRSTQGSAPPSRRRTRRATRRASRPLPHTLPRLPRAPPARAPAHRSFRAWQLLAFFLLVCLLLLVLAAMQASTYCDPLVLVSWPRVKKSRELRALAWGTLLVLA